MTGNECNDLSQSDKDIDNLLRLSDSDFRDAISTDYHGWYVNPSGVTSLEHIKAYRKRLREDLNVTHIGADRQQREWADKVSEHKREVDARLSQLAFQDKHESWIVPRNEVEEIRSLSIPQRTSITDTPRSADWEEWRNVFEKYSLNELTFIRDAIYEYYASGMDTTSRGQIIDMFRFKKGASIQIDDIVRMTKRGKGASRSKVIEHAHQTFNALDPVIAGFMVSWLTEIKTNLEPQRTRSGYHSRSNKHINMSSEWDWDWMRDHDSVSSTTAHELSHFFHYMVGLYEENTGTDNRDSECGDWEASINVFDGTDELNEYRTQMVELWEKFEQGEIEPLSEYQTKNFDEFTTVAFEWWIAEPSGLFDTQPELFDLFETHLSDSRKQPRIAANIAEAMKDVEFGQVSPKDNSDDDKNTLEVNIDVTIDSDTIPDPAESSE